MKKRKNPILSLINLILRDMKRFVLQPIVIFFVTACCFVAGSQFAYAENSPFKMLLRLWPSHHQNDTLRSDLLQALQEYPKLWDEVWLCMETTTLDENKHLQSAKRMATLAKDLKKSGLGVAIQGITIGHGDSFEFSNSETIPQHWTTVIGPNGEQTHMENCPRQEAFLQYLERTYAAYAAACQPSVVWLDDDLRINHHAPAPMLCFCPTCLDAFNQQFGCHFDRESLVRQLNENTPASLIVRKNWIRFSQESLALVARRISRAVHQVSPQTRMGLQHANFHRELMEGYDWNLIFEAMRAETGLEPASRPGNGFYQDHDPQGMIGKAYDMARQVRRLPSGISQIAAEVEGYPHRATGKSPHGLCVESQLYLALGVTQLSYAIICGAYEPMEWYSSHYFKALNQWKSFYETYASFNLHTEPGGLNPYISQQQVLRCEPNMPPFAWVTTQAQSSTPALSTLGLPLCPDARQPQALLLDAEAVLGLGEEEGRELFTHRGILIDQAGWSQAVQRGFTASLKSTECSLPFHFYLSEQGKGRVAVVSSFTTELTGGECRQLLAAADWCANHQLPVILEDPCRMIVVPRVTSTGSLRSVCLLNPSITDAESVSLRLRGCADARRLVWRQAGRRDCRLRFTRQGDEICVKVPLVEKWNTGYIAII